MARISYRKAVNQALDQEMARDANVILMGIDVGGGSGGSGGSGDRSSRSVSERSSRSSRSSRSHASHSNSVRTSGSHRSSRSHHTDRSHRSGSSHRRRSRSDSRERRVYAQDHSGGERGSSRTANSSYRDDYDDMPMPPSIT